MKKVLKRSLSAVLALCMIFSMLTCAFTAASAEESTRLTSWDGYITTQLSLNSYSADDGQYLKIDNTDLFTGDSIKWNGGWLNGEFSYTDSEGTSASSKINGRASWYCDGTWMFNSYLYFGGIANAMYDNTPQVLSAAGTWVCKATLQSGVTITLVSFEVKQLPRVVTDAQGNTIFGGSQNVKVYDKTGIPFENDNLYVGDKLTNGSGWWQDNTNVAFEIDGSNYTGKITYLYIDTPTKGTKSFTVWNDGAIDYVLPESGTYTVRGQAEGVKDADGNSVSGNLYPTFRTFTVNSIPRLTYDFDGNINYDGAINVSVYQANGIPFSTEELYVGDKLVNGSSWWTNTGISVEIDGEAYTGRITWLTITDPNGKIATGYHVWNGGAIDYVLKTAGTYTLTGKVENLKDAEGTDCGSKEPVTLRTFTVKECPHSYELTETVAPTCTSKGYDIYTCAYCSDAKKVNLVDAKGHNLTYVGGVVTCSDCDYTKEYTGAAESLTYKSNDRTGMTAYTTMPAAAFVGDTITKSGDGWWDAKLPFTIYDENDVAYTGSSYHAWIMLGSTEKKHFKPGIGENGQFTFDEPGTYTLVGQIETSGLGYVKIVLATIEVFDPADFKVSAASVTLQSNIQLNYKVDSGLFSEAAGYSAPYMTFTLNGKTTTVDTPVEDGGYYVFRFSNIAPDKMNDTITSVLYATKDGENVQIENEYSIATYCYNLLGNSTDSDSELRTLLVDMLNYGAASQLYTNYNTDNLVNAALTEEQNGWKTSETPVLTDNLNTAAKTVENAAAEWIGAALRLTDRVEMKFILQTENISGLTVKFTDSTGDVEYATVASKDFERRAAGGYYVYFDGFDASQMRDVVYVTAYNGDTAVSNTIAYSVETYAYAKQNSTVANLGDLVKAMMKYGDAAEAYKNAV